MLSKVLWFCAVFGVLIFINACSTYFEAEKVHYERNISSEVLHETE